MTISEKVKKGLEKDFILKNIRRNENSSEMNSGQHMVFDLTVHHPLNEPPKAFENELKKLMESQREGLHRYMENAGYTATRAAIASHLTRDTGLEFRLDHIIMTSGASGGINITLKALLNPGEEVILFSPLNFDYEAYVENHAGVCKIVPSGEDFIPDLAALAEMISPKTKAFIINSPNDPTGTVYDDSTLKKITDIVTAASARFKTRIYALSDDTYRQFCYREDGCPWILKYYPHTIIINSYSKNLSIPGERIGFAAIHPQCEDAATVIGGMIHANRTLGFVNAPALMQNVVFSLSNHTIDTGEYRIKRDFLFEQLTGMGYSLIKPQGSFYLFPRTPITDDLAFSSELKNFGVLTIPGSLFRFPGHIRISYCVDKKVLEGSLAGFRKAIEQFKE